jgi:hypothetical protein
LISTLPREILIVVAKLNGQAQVCARPRRLPATRAAVRCNQPSSMRPSFSPPGCPSPFRGTDRHSAKVTGLAQRLQVGPRFWLQIAIKCLNLAKLLSQPCDLYAHAARRYGELQLFYGNQCVHYTLPNATDHTRVSIDFRVIPRTVRPFGLAGWRHARNRRARPCGRTRGYPAPQDNTPPYYCAWAVSLACGGFPRATPRPCACGTAGRASPLGGTTRRPGRWPAPTVRARGRPSTPMTRPQSRAALHLVSRLKRFYDMDSKFIVLFGRTLVTTAPRTCTRLSISFYTLSKIIPILDKKCLHLRI